MSKTQLPQVPRGRGIFCNRTLNFRSLRAIGYDMDYTLIQYNVDEWEAHSFEYAVALMKADGWPVEGLEFDPHQMLTGLFIDREYGNLLKVNRFGYVKRARHGTKAIPYEHLRSLYSRTIVDHDNPRFAFLATLFSVSESSIYAQMVDRFDEGELPDVRTYEDLQRQVRHYVDTAHRQGKLKQAIMADPNRFVLRDPDTSRALLDQRAAGKKTILITNSGWTYTSQMMTFAIDPYLPEGTTWRDLFDLIVVSAGKPSFFTSRTPFLEVVDESGMLRPMFDDPVEGGIYHGANPALVEEVFGVGGDQILYVGDHLFGDVHSSKNVLRWRTALVVPELESELHAIDDFARRQAALTTLMRQKESLEAIYCQRRLALLRANDKVDSPQVMDELRAAVKVARAEIGALDENIGPLAGSSAQLMNPNWGLLMRAGNDKSYLARVLEGHADIYTSRVSNFLFQTPYKYFRSPRGSLPHDLGGGNGRP